MKNICKMLGALCLVSSFSFEITCSQNLYFLSCNKKWLDAKQVQALMSAKSLTEAKFIAAVDKKKTANECYFITKAQEVRADVTVVQSTFNTKGYQAACDYIAPFWHRYHPGFDSQDENDPLLDTQSSCCCTIL